MDVVVDTKTEEGGDEMKVKEARCGAGVVPELHTFCRQSRLVATLPIANHGSPRRHLPILDVVNRFVGNRPVVRVGKQNNSKARSKREFIRTL